MWKMIWPVLVVVASNTLYNICAKSTPSSLNAFASLSISYAVAAACALALFFVTSEQKNIVMECAKANWSSYALGLGIVGLEFGFISIYRAGWKISVGHLVASLTLSCVLLAVGILFYKEVLSVKQLIGLGVCALGLFLIM